MRNLEEIIFEINSISELKEYKTNHKIELANRHSFNRHLRLCKPIHKRLFFKGASEKDWKSWLDEGTEYYLLFIDDKPVARCAVERYSDAAWETADVKTALNHRNKGLSKWCALLRTVFKNQEPRASQRQRKNENISVFSFFLFVYIQNFPFILHYYRAQK